MNQDSWNYLQHEQHVLLLKEVCQKSHYFINRKFDPLLALHVVAAHKHKCHNVRTITSYIRRFVPFRAMSQTDIVVHLCALLEAGIIIDAAIPGFQWIRQIGSA